MGMVPKDKVMDTQQHKPVPFQDLDAAAEGIVVKRKPILYDKEGRLIDSFYISSGKAFQTLEEAKFHVRDRMLQKVHYVFFDYRDATYYSFIIYSNI